MWTYNWVDILALVLDFWISGQIQTKFTVCFYHVQRAIKLNRTILCFILLCKMVVIMIKYIIFYNHYWLFKQILRFVSIQPYFLNKKTKSSLKR